MRCHIATNIDQFIPPRLLRSNRQQTRTQQDKGSHEANQATAWWGRAHWRGESERRVAHATARCDRRSRNIARAPERRTEHHRRDGKGSAVNSFDQQTGYLFDVVGWFQNTRHPAPQQGQPAPPVKCIFCHHSPPNSPHIYGKKPIFSAARSTREHRASDDLAKKYKKFLPRHPSFSFVRS